jgi:hypothetical protein
MWQPWLEKAKQKDRVQNFPPLKIIKMDKKLPYPGHIFIMVGDEKG